MKTTAIVQARMGSTRLNGKVMKDLFGKTVLAHDIERIRLCKEIDEIIIATTSNVSDDVIAEEALKNGAKVFRGSEEDVLSRYYYAAKESGADIVCRATSDCPLIDPFVCGELISFYKSNEYDVVTNAAINVADRTYPRGLDFEVFSFSALESAANNAQKSYEREHVTPYIYENGFKVYVFKNEIDYSNLRWTLDTEEDWQLIYEIYKLIYRGKHDFYMQDIINVFNQHPYLFRLNENVLQKDTHGGAPHR